MLCYYPYFVLEISFPRVKTQTWVWIKSTECWVLNCAWKSCWKPYFFSNRLQRPLICMHYRIQRLLLTNGNAVVQRVTFSVWKFPEVAWHSNLSALLARWTREKCSLCVCRRDEGRLFYIIYINELLVQEGAVRTTPRPDQWACGIFMH